MWSGSLQQDTAGQCLSECHIKTSFRDAKVKKIMSIKYVVTPTPIIEEVLFFFFPPKILIPIPLSALNTQLQFQK